jgi:hypothetical protein
MGTDSDLRAGDIEAIRSKRREEGQPLKSQIVIKDGKQYHYQTDKRGNVHVTDQT